jgi:hypothetical protein
MRHILVCIILCAAQAVFSQNYVLPDSTLMVHLTNSNGEGIMGAKLLVDGKAMTACTDCFAASSQEGCYFLKSSGYKNNVLQIVHMVITHPDYQLYNDSVLLYYPIKLRRPDEGYCYMGSKIPMKYAPEITVAFTENEKKEDLMNALLNTHGTMLSSSNYCGDDSWNRSFGPTKYVIKHPSRMEAIAFQKMYRLSGAIAFMDVSSMNGSAFTREFSVQFHANEAQGERIKAMLEEWLGQGKIESYHRRNSAFESNQAFQVKLTPEEIINANLYIEALQTTGRITAYMQVFAWACLD